MHSAYFQLVNCNSRRDCRRIRRGVGAIPGVTGVGFNDATARLGVDYGDITDSASIRRRIETMGYGVIDVAEI